MKKTFKNIIVLILLSLGVGIISPAYIVHAAEKNESDMIYTYSEEDFQNAIHLNPDKIVMLDSIYSERGYNPPQPQKWYISGSQLEKHTGIKFITGSSAADSVILGVLSKLMKASFWKGLGIGLAVGIFQDALNANQTNLKNILYKIAKKQCTGIVVVATPNPGGYPVLRITFSGYY